jgi:DNA (cytosine-5)-methyltransferase 1
VPSALASPPSASVKRKQPRRQLSGSDLTVVELFAGSGGLALGLARAGLTSWDRIELNEACCETLRANGSLLQAPQAGTVEARDVHKVDFDQYRGVDLIAAGAPCQPFSQGGGLRGQYDERNMFPEVVRAIGEARPRAFLIENVRGLLFEKAAPYFKSVLARLRNPAISADRDISDLYHLRAPGPGPKDEYSVHYALLNAADFGLAQNRPRLFVVGIRRGEASWSWPVGRFSRSSLVDALRRGSYWDEHPVPESVREASLRPIRLRDAPPDGKRWRTLRDLVTTLPEASASPEGAADQAHVLVPGARLYAKHTGSRLDWVAKTVKAGVHGTPGGEHILLLDDGSHRYLTVRECAALQGFPTRYKLPDKRTPAMRQLGNAVPVAVAEALGKRLAAALSRA